MRPNGVMAFLAGVALVFGAASHARAQGGSTRRFNRALPSERLGSGFFGGVTRGSQFTGGAGGSKPLGPLAVRFSVSPERIGGGYSPSRFDFSNLKANLAGLRLRTLESFALAKRARFAGLQRMSLEVAGMVGGGNLAGRVDVRTSYFQFVFPFGLRDKPAEYGYGYFCLGCLNRGLIKDPDGFLAEFSAEAQETISDETFKQALASMVSAGKLPEGQQLDQFYDSQLAAMGNFLFSNRRFAPATDVWAVLAKRDATGSLFAQAAGQSLFAARRFEQASDELRRSLHLAAGWGTPEFHITGANLQNIYADPGDLAEARMNLEALVEKSPHDTKLQFLMGYIDVFHGLRDRAKARLLDLAGKGDTEAGQLAEVLASGRIGDGSRRPFAAADMLTAADVAQMSKDVLLTPDERKGILDAVLDPQGYEDYMTRGDFYFFMGDYSKASLAYETAAKLQPENAIPKFAVAHAGFANGEFGFAARRLREGLQMEPNWGLFNFSIEEFFGDRHDLDKRLRDLEHLVKLEPDNTNARMLLGYVHYFDGHYGKAAELLADVVRESPTNQAADALLKLAQLQS